MASKMAGSIYTFSIFSFFTLFFLNVPPPPLPTLIVSGKLKVTALRKMPVSLLSAGTTYDCSDYVFPEL